MTYNTDMKEKKVSIVKRAIYDVKIEGHKQEAVTEREFDLNDPEDREYIYRAIIGNKVTSISKMEDVRHTMVTEITKLLEEIYEELPFH